MILDRDRALKMAISTWVREAASGRSCEFAESEHHVAGINPLGTKPV